MIDRDDLLRRVDLAALLDELSAAPPTRLGPAARWRCIDPGHDDQHPSVTMFTDRNGIQRWRCWSGGHGGTAIDALVTARRVTVADAITELAHRARLPDPIHPRPPRRIEAAPPVVAVERPVSPALLEYVAACERLLWRPAGRPVLDYLVHRRGLAPDVLEANHVGADPGPDTLRRASGLPRRGPAALLPALDRDGQVTYVQARYLEPSDGRPKYDNPASRLAANPRISWTTPTRTQHPGHLVVSEGVIDALTASSVGLHAVAVLAASYADGRVAAQIALSAAGRHVVLAFDGDPAGHTAAHAFAAALTDLGCSSLILPLPAASDINTVLRRDSQWIRRHLDTAQRPGPALPELGRMTR